MIFIISTILLEIAFHFPECKTQTSTTMIIILKDGFEKAEIENREGRKQIVIIQQVTEVINWTRDVEKRKEQKKEKKQRHCKEWINNFSYWFHKKRWAEYGKYKTRVLTKIKLLDEQENGLGENG